MRIQLIVATIILFFASIWFGYTVAPRTSYNFTYVRVPKILLSHKPENFATTTLIFGGDVMLDRAIRQKTAAQDYQIFDDELVSLFSSADLAIVNLEGPVTDAPSISMPAPFLAPESYSFTFDPLSLNELLRAGIDVVSQGNNHIRDQGPQGVHQSEIFLTQAGITHFGTPNSTHTLYATKTIDGTTFAFIAYNQFIPTASENEFLELIGSISSTNDFVIVYSHWGDEYEFVPTIEQQDLAHKFIDAGADLVVGAHPHVIQTFETYKEKLIAYSLGNLVFDQWFEESVRVGALLHVEINPNKRTYETSATCIYLNRDATTSNILCPNDVSVNANTFGRF